MKDSKLQFSPAYYETVTDLAYRLCLEEGCKPGDALRFWEEAELWLRYRDVEPDRLEAPPVAQPDEPVEELIPEAAAFESATPAEGRPLASVELVAKSASNNFAFREASFALPALKSNQPAPVGGWRPRTCRPSRTPSGRRLQFWTHI